MGTYYDTGRRYNILLENALVVGTRSERGGTTDLTVKLTGPNGSQTSTILHIPLDHAGVTVTPVPPPNWPPEPGDVWEADDKRWFALASRDGEGEIRSVVFVNEDGRYAHSYFADPIPWDDPTTLLNNSTKVLLISRKSQPPEQSTQAGDYPDFNDEPPF
ncbi:hypothetical protein FAF44_02760 [Nonomuraea sp. MG754425]|uniref:hypothetical protein n=1 Tax=Nonomuraea sp. MG754425 TaxID=2570319 RepID=UPI001F16CA5E|nr:hypothetical protein [Nonomuraea sp. MG754425]MCF6467335.1 hypothetical protein [Nonomuraea sp. MG754425]